MVQVITHIFSVGPRCALLAKAGLHHAFRLIPVVLSQRWLLGYHWEGRYSYDVRPPFGLRSTFSLFTDLAYVLAITTRFHSHHHQVHHYLDDFFFLQPATTHAYERASSTFLSPPPICER